MRELADLIAALRPTPPRRVVRVAIDGPDAAGKTTLAARLAGLLASTHTVLRCSVDDFHHPPQIRHRQGSLSPAGYYQDSFDYPAVRGRLTEIDQSAEDAVLLFEGVFLLRPELRACWDFTVYLDISPDESLRRALIRDVELFGSPQVVRERYRQRYLPGQQLYREAAAPMRVADVVIDNHDPARPRVLKRPRSGDDRRPGHRPRSSS
jgi:uridine kinase